MNYNKFIIQRFAWHHFCNRLLNLRRCAGLKHLWWSDVNCRLCSPSVASHTVICGGDVTKWQPRTEWPFDRRSLQSSHQRRRWASQSEPSTHRCTRLSPAHSCCCPSEQARGEDGEKGKKEKGWMVLPRQQGICVLSLHIHSHIFSYNLWGVHLKLLFSRYYDLHL